MLTVCNKIVNRTRKPARRSARTSQRKTGGQAILTHGLNAFHPLHIPLPHVTGGYSVVRTISTFTSSDYMTVLGCVDMPMSDCWSDLCALGITNSSDALGAGHWKPHFLPSPTGTDSTGFAEVAPSAVSVQVSNPQSLTNASGTVFMGRCKTTLSQPPAGDTRTAEAFANALMSYNAPKMLAGARLAMTTQQVNLIPSNISELMDFKEMKPTSSVIPSSQTWGTGEDFSGFKPAYIINPSGIPLQYRLCIEWKVRLSPFNPMHSVQQTHPPTPQNTWHRILDSAESAGHGVEDVGVVGAAGYMMSGGVGEGFLAEAGSYALSAASAALPALEAAAPLALML